MQPEAVAFVRAFFDAGKSVAAICHAPWLLVEADVVRGRTLTSWPSLRTDIRNAGGRWVDEPVVVDRGLVASRKPDEHPGIERQDAPGVPRRRTPRAARGVRPGSRNTAGCAAQRWNEPAIRYHPPRRAHSSKAEG
jgi:hypothetical protein